MNTNEHKLDNPVWNSLNEFHAGFALEYDGGKCYKPEYCPFGGFVNFENFNEELVKYATETDNFYIVGDTPEYKGELTKNKILVCNQMVLDQPFKLEINESIVELKTSSQKKELFNLVNLIQPGYFNQKTSELGKYFGIYKNGQLVAVTGERMKMNEYTEVSAVVTHSEHTGKGYAKQLIKHVTNLIFQENKIPYLHVADFNIGAIKLYEKSGFVTRRKINFTNLINN